QALAAIGARRCPELDAIEEMLTLGLQGLARLERNGDGLCLQRARHTVPPIDAVGKHHKLALPWLAVIEHRHSVAPDYDKFLFLERMKPGDEHVRALTAREAQVRGGYVGDLFVEVIAPDRFDRFRLLSNQGKNHRQIMRREAPQYVFFAANLS